MGVGAVNEGRSVGEQWSPEGFMGWFDRFWGSDDAVANVRRVAAKTGIEDLADDLGSEWYVRMASTMRSKAASGQPAGWMADEDEARAYAYRVLQNAAYDLVRCRSRHVELPVDVAVDPPDPLDRIELEGVMNDLVSLEGSVTGRGRRSRSLPAAMGVIEVALGIRRLQFGAEDPLGGTDEWSRALCHAMEQLWPDLKCTGEARHDQRVRQTRSRCGRSVRSLLRELCERRGLVPA